MSPTSRTDAIGTLVKRWAKSRAYMLAEIFRATPLAWLVLTIPLAATFWGWHTAATVGLRSARELFREERDRKTDVAKANFEQAMDATYSALRAVAVLPAVVDIDRYGGNLQGDGRVTVQQLCSYLASHVAVSKVHIATLDMAPDQTDSATAAPRAPIATFEDFDETRSHRAEEADPAIERVTTLENQELATLVQYFGRRYPDKSAIDGMNYPAATSREIVTSDNTDYTAAHRVVNDDSPRTGIVYAVPFYGPDGKLKGVVAAVLRTRVLARLFEEPYFVVTHGAVQYCIEAAGTQKMLGAVSVQLMRDGREPAGHPYARAIQCDRFVDRHPWVLATAVPQGVFEAYPAVRAAEARSQVVLAAGVTVSLFVFSISWSLATTRRRAVVLAESMTEKLRLQERAMTAAHNGIVITDRAGTILWVNPAFSALTGYTADEAIGKNPRILKSHAHDDAFFRKMNETIYAGQVWHGEIVNRRKDGTLYTEEMIITPVSDERGEIGHFIAVKQDITARKRMEDELAKARDAALETARMKSEFLANMSHEIRTPMNGIIGMAGLMLDTKLNSEQQEYAETIRACGDTLLTIVNDILDFSKIEAGKLAFETIDFELRSVVESVLDLLAEQAHRKKLELACLVHQDLPDALRGDPGRVRQVLVNLVGNAIKFTERGEVIVRAVKQAETDTHVTVRFSVQDTGIGISKEAQERLFQAFSQADGSTTRKYGGTGLGLAISKRLVELMSGTVGIDSEPGQGSTFWFTAQFERGVSRGRDGARHHLDFHQLRVLVVDDNQTNRKIVTHQLRSWGIRHSAEAASGSEALELLRREAATGTAFHIVVLDMQMPGMDGVMLAQAIKADPTIATTQLIVMSSLGRLHDDDQLRQIGIAIWLTKPVKQSRLYDCIATVMGAPTEDESTSDEVPASVAIVPALTGEHRRARILLAEDNPVNQKVALRQLQKLGYSADPVANGLEVLDALHRIPYDLVLMDCQMPELDGYATTGEIRRREGATKHTPIVAMTAHALEGDREKCLAAGMDDYISKPVKTEELKAALERWLSRLEPVTAPTDTSAPAAPVGDLPAVDIQKLRDACDGDDQFIREIVDSYLTQTSQQLDKLRIAIAATDAPNVERLAHTAAGASLATGMVAIVPILRELERLGHDGQLASAGELCVRAVRELERVKTQLWNHFNPTGAPVAPPAPAPEPQDSTSLA